MGRKTKEANPVPISSDEIEDDGWTLMPVYSEGIIVRTPSGKMKFHHHPRDPKKVHYDDVYLTTYSPKYNTVDAMISQYLGPNTMHAPLIIATRSAQGSKAPKLLSP